MPNTTITPSADLVTVPAIDAGSNVVLTSASYVSWAACFAANPTIQDFLLSPGDYTAWGAVGLTSVGGTSSRPKTLRYYHSDDATHPVNRANHALIGDVGISGSAAYWLLQGLTQRGSTGIAVNLLKGTGITLDKLLIEDMTATGTQGVRVREGTDDTIQRCVIRRCAPAPSKDDTGIQIKTNGPGKVIRNCRVLDCEIYDFCDQIQVTKDGTDGFVSCDYTIKNCDLYITSYRLLASGLSSAENAIDLKAGSDTYKSYVQHNRCWGFRVNDPLTGGTGSAGNCIESHEFARNIDIEDNIIDDVVCGFREFNWDPSDAPLETTRSTAVRRNWFLNCHAQPDQATDPSACIEPLFNTPFVDNVFARSDYVLMKNSAYRVGGPTFTGNVRVGVTTNNPAGTSGSNWDESLNTSTAAPASYNTYQRKYWTGIVTADGPLAAASLSHRGHTSAASVVGSVSHRGG